MLETFDTARLASAGPRTLSDVLEQGRIVYLPRCPVELPEEADLDVLIATVDRLKPDIVILDHDDPTFDPRLPILLIHDRPSIKVITLGLENNSMEIYDRYRVLIREKADLLAAVDC